MGSWVNMVFLDCCHISFSVFFIRLNFLSSRPVSGQVGYKREEPVEYKEVDGGWKQLSSVVRDVLSVALSPL